MCHRLFEFREGQLKEHLCDIKEFMEKRKLERFMELKSVVVEPKEIKNAELKISNENPVNSDKEKELKQLKSQLTKIEKEIETLELILNY